MTRPTFAAAAGIGVAITLGFIGFGCSSSTPSSGTGGATGTGGAATGTGGKGTGGTTGTGGGMDAGPTLPMCASPAPGDGTACNSDPSCTKNCGLNTSTLVNGRAMKACTCSGPAGTWSCPSTNGACVYPAALDLACFHIPSPVPACPSQSGDGGADAGSPLIKSGTTSCVPPNSEVCGNLCGSATANTYLDNGNNPKMGYCVCINGMYQCASVNEWPPQQ